MSVEKVKELLKSYLETKNKLKELEPNFNWSNLIGDYGEYVAINHYNLKQVETGTAGFDAINGRGKTVQIKTIRNTTTSIKFSKGADYLLVISLENNADWKELYYGPMEKVKKFISYPNKKGEFTVNISKLKKIANKTAKPKEDLELNIAGKLIVATNRREMLKKLAAKGYDVPVETTLNSRLSKGWTLEQAFGLKVPPKYTQYEHLVTSKNYNWFPYKPTQESDSKPLVSDFERRVYVTQKFFCQEHEIPEWYLTDKKEEMDLANIVMSYRNIEKKKLDS